LEWAEGPGKIGGGGEERKQKADSRKQERPEGSGFRNGV
jgi:hypothetical protein